MREEEKEKGTCRKTIVVTVRCIDIPAQFSDHWKKACDMCGEMTWVSASWKGKRIDEVICESCYFANKDREDFGVYDACVTKANILEFQEWSKRYYGYEMTIEDIIKIMEKKVGKKIKLV